MYKLNISELAHHDLERIVSYITVNLVNPMAATNFLDQVEKSYYFLKNNPYMYKKCQNIRLEKEGYHKIPNFIGTKEIIENGVRMVYEMSYHENQKEIKFLKYTYDSKEVVEQFVFDSITGEEIDQ